MVLGENVLLMEGAVMAPTCKVALAGVVLETGPSSPVDLSVFTGMVLIWFPAVLEVTSMDTVQEPGAAAVVCLGTIPPLKEKIVPPGAAVTVPPHVFDTFAGLATLSPGW